MRRFLTTMMLAQAIIAAGTAYAGQTLPLTAKTSATQEEGSLPVEFRSTPVTYKTDIKPTPLKTRSKELSVSAKEELLFEDFENAPIGGYTDEDGCTTLIASHSEAPGRYLDESYTPETGTWSGNFVYASPTPGCVRLQTFNSMNQAYLATPLGDYSGDITVTMRVKWAKNFWGSPNGWKHPATGAVALTACVGGYEQWHSADSELGGGVYSYNFFEDTGWLELTFSFRNNSADNDGFLRIYTSYAVDIDWIKVENHRTYLAAPTYRPVTDFKEDSFTINWDRVKMSTDYYVDLWRMNYTAEKGLDETYGFDDGNVPDGFTLTGGEVNGQEGMNGSSAVKLGNAADNVLQTCEYSEKLTTASFQVKFDVSNSDVYSYLVIDGYNGEEWINIGSTDTYYVENDVYYIVELEGSGFEKQFNALRIYTEGFGDNDAMYIDDLKVTGPRPYELVRQGIGDDGKVCDNITDEDDDDYFNNFGKTNDNFFTFEGLDPEAEYWYRVRSHYKHKTNDFHNGPKCHALGVAMPEILAPTMNGNNTSYTANWKDVAKAQNYILTNYEVTPITADSNDFTIAEEGFSGCVGSSSANEMTSLGNAEEMLLDDYTDLKGWTGIANGYGDGMLGCVEYYGAYLKTPMLMVNPKRGAVSILIEATGTTDDYIRITCPGTGIDGSIPFDENGFLSGILEFESLPEKAQIKLESKYSYPFAISTFEVMQDVKEGDMVRTFVEEVTVPAGLGYHDFTGLIANGIYAYEVKAQYTLEDQTVYSQTTLPMSVNLSDGSSFEITKTELIDAEGLEIVGRYSIDGRSVSENEKGLVIVKLSDGSYRKIIVR